MGIKNIARVNTVIFTEAAPAVNTPRQVQAPGESPRMEIDPSSPILVCRVYNTRLPFNNPTQEAYMLHAGDSLEIEPGSRDLYIAPHSPIPNVVVLSDEGMRPLIAFRPFAHDRKDRPVRPSYYRFRDYVGVGAVPLAGLNLQLLRVAVPMWDAMRIWVQAAFGGATAGTIQVDGEAADEAANQQVTALLAPVAIPKGASNQWVLLGDSANPNSCTPWARILVALAGVGTHDLRIAVELQRVMTG